MNIIFVSGGVIISLIVIAAGYAGFLEWRCIKDITICIAAILAIVAFFIWRRQPLLSKKLEIFEKVYLYIEDFKKVVYTIYSPLIIHGRLGLDKNHDEIRSMTNDDIRLYILNYRQKEIKKNFQIATTIISNQSIFLRYFPKFEEMINKIRELRDGIMIANVLELNDRSDPLSYLDDDYITLIRNSFDNPLDSRFLNYKNDAMVKIDSYLKSMEEEFDSLVRHFW